MGGEERGSGRRGVKDRGEGMKEGRRIVGVCRTEKEGEEWRVGWSVLVKSLKRGFNCNISLVNIIPWRLLGGGVIDYRPGHKVWDRERFLQKLVQGFKRLNDELESKINLFVFSTLNLVYVFFQLIYILSLIKVNF